MAPVQPITPSPEPQDDMKKGRQREGERKRHGEGIERLPQEKHAGGERRERNKGERWVGGENEERFI